MQNESYIFQFLDGRNELCARKAMFLDIQKKNKNNFDSNPIPTNNIMCGSAHEHCCRAVARNYKNRIRRITNKNR